MKQPVLVYYDMHSDVVAFSTTRQGGFSTGRYSEFNINRYCGDTDEAIRQNRALLCRLLDIRDDQLIMPHQVHQTEIAVVDENRDRNLEGIDALMTNVPGLCIGISTADCIPVLLYDPIHHAICAIHAGWRGTVQRIVEKAVCKMTEVYGSCPTDIVAQIGPGISLDSFEVGDEVYDAFTHAGFDMSTISRRFSLTSHHSPLTSNEKWHIDLPECNRQQLMAAGVAEAHISVAGICTVKQADTFFSARRLGIESGRIFTGIIFKHSNL